MSNDPNKSTIKGSVCPNCGGQLDINTDDWTAVCQYCGAEFQPDLTDQEKIELTKVSAKNKLERDKFEYAVSKAKKSEEERVERLYKGSKRFVITVILLAACGMFCLVGFQDGAIVSGLVAGIQAVLLLFSILFGFQIIKNKSKKISLILFIVALVLIIPFTASMSSDVGLDDSFKWEKMALANKLPDPGTNNGHVYDDGLDELHVEVEGYSSTEYNEYINKCREKGFNVDEKEVTNDTFAAFNNEGYKLELEFTDYSSLDNEMDITLTAPIEMGDIDWPDTGIATKLPKPGSTKGKVEQESSGYYCVYVGNITKDGFKDYVGKCKDKGFSLDYETHDGYYSAENKKGDNIRIEYYGNNIIFIEIDEDD